MFDDLFAYYHENVVSAFIAYRDTSRNAVVGRSHDLRMAMIAANALFHLREHLPKSGRLSRKNVELACPDYALLGDVANAVKHKLLTNDTPHGVPLIKDASSIIEKILIIEYKDEKGIYRYIQKTVVIQLVDGSEKNFLHILTNVINFWELHMQKLGVLPTARTFSFDGDVRARTRAECNTDGLNFEIVQGLRFHQTMELLRFDNATGKATPIDLTGCEAIFRIYQPAEHDVDLYLTNDSSGKEFKTTISLTEDEILMLSRISSDADKQTYINSLPSIQFAFRQLAIDAGLFKL